MAAVYDPTVLCIVSWVNVLFIKENAVSMWLEDIQTVDTHDLEGLCDELEMKLEEGRRELADRENQFT